MNTRAEILKRFKLEDRTAFEVEPYCERGVWRIKVGHDGDPKSLLSKGDAELFAEEVRSVDNDLAGQLENCLGKARRYSENPKRDID